MALEAAQAVLVWVQGLTGYGRSSIWYIVRQGLVKKCLSEVTQPQIGIIMGLSICGHRSCSLMKLSARSMRALIHLAFFCFVIIILLALCSIWKL